MPPTSFLHGWRRGRPVFLRFKTILRGAEISTAVAGTYGRGARAVHAPGERCAGMISLELSSFERPYKIHALAPRVENSKSQRTARTGVRALSAVEDKNIRRSVLSVPKLL